MRNRAEVLEPHVLDPTVREAHVHGSLSHIFRGDGFDGGDHDVAVAGLPACFDSLYLVPHAQDGAVQESAPGSRDGCANRGRQSCSLILEPRGIGDRPNFGRSVLDFLVAFRYAG